MHADVLSWREALEAEGIQHSVWRIHRKIGMSGGLLTNMLLREIGSEIDSERIEHLRRLHAAAYNRRSADIRPLPGARELAYLTQTEIPWAIATSGRMETARPALESHPSNEAILLFLRAARNENSDHAGHRNSVPTKIRSQFAIRRLIIQFARA
jgi:phosphoglycolate phosphatase-like HAD superfamily hydrolase